MRIFGIAGWKGSGKTTMIDGLLPRLCAAELKVATVKHAHHGFDFVPAGHPAERWRKAGARDIVLAGRDRWAVTHDLRNENEPTLDAMLDQLSEVDLALVEGWKASRHEKLEVYRAETGNPMLATGNHNIVAIATDDALPPAVRERLSPAVFALDAFDEIVAFILGHCGLADREERHGAAQ